MDIKAFLTMDMSALTGWVERGWSWWSGELRAMLPAKLRGQAGLRSSLVAEFSGGEIVLRDHRAGEAGLRMETVQQVSQLTLALPASAVLLREMTLPALPSADLRRLIALDMDRIAPLRNEDVIFDMERGASVSGGRRQITLGIVRRQTLQEMLERLLALGAGRPRAISLVDRQNGIPRFDFLKAERIAEGGTAAITPGTLWWIAVGVLVVFNIALLIARDISVVSDLRDQVDAQQLSVTLATALQRRIQAEGRSRQELLRRRTDRAPLPLLAAVTHALPDGAYVQRFEWNGVTLHLVGEAQGSTNVAALLSASGVARRVRATMPGRPAAGGAFDVTLEPRAGRRP
jgi:HAMP domain-containing protein